MPFEEEVPQPFLPRVRMIWLFVAITVVAIALGIIQAADQGHAFAAALVFTCVFLFLFAMFSGASFLVSYFFGFAEKNLGASTVTESPFADGRLPDQQIPPSPTEVI
jgi:ABC-type dipeptide/oligopeptide/nickel transport system permease component